MNKHQQNMVKMVTLMMIAFVLGVLVGEAVRDHKYPAPGETKEGTISEVSGKGKQIYSGLFILLKLRIDLAADILTTLMSQVLHSVVKLVWGNVRTLV